MRTCNVCDAVLDELLYKSPNKLSITSLCEIWKGETIIHRCSRCGHIQTDELPDIEAYYDHEYNILIESEDEDQIYRIENGVPVYRTDHQVSVFTSQIPLTAGTRVLDYGCAKGAVLRRLKALRPDVLPYLFDVSNRYIDFWRAFASPDTCATYKPRTEWDNYFDVVTSFYAFEHIGRPREALREIHRMLKPGALFYCVVPNVFTNSADFIVADHVNHFTERSLSQLLWEEGFSIDSLDERTHEGAFIVIGRRTDGRMIGGDRGAVVSGDPRVTALSEYWRTAGMHVRKCEEGHANARRAVIYGSGFYGTFIATCLEDFSRIECFLDRNPHRQGKRLLDRAIIAPDQLDSNVELIYVGLNPRSARASIAEITGWDNRNYHFCYL